ncbi:E3 SUMO-protein ligase ZBED1-like isoform X2 [Prorops nasuta]|uniref:E3 SUMO-protein ligase ZBED1-like isoform X2 n=1 Tax=Prorops nasuta TaxID=863751 RepID=UPI0034CE027C
MEEIQTSSANNNHTSFKRNIMMLEDNTLELDDPDWDKANITNTTNIQSSSGSNLERKQPRIDNQIIKQKSFEEGGKKSNRNNNNILFMITKDNMPLQTVEKEGFKVFVNSLVPLYKIPSRCTMTRLMEEKYNILSNLIKVQLSNVDNISLTTDIWTEPLNTKSFLGLTAHFIKKDRHKSITIGVTELTERHSSEYIEMWLLNVVKEWKINITNIVVIVCDNGANIKKAVKDAFGVETQLSCFAHTLNLIPSKVIESDNINYICRKVKIIVAYFKKSVIAMDNLRAVSDLKLIQSIDTRWNSTHDMLVRFIELSEKIGSVILRLPAAPSMITATELQTSKEFVELLKPFKDATMIICGEYYMTASKAIPIVNTLKAAISQSEPKTVEDIKDENYSVSVNINNNVNNFWLHHLNLVHKSKEKVSAHLNKIPDDLQFYLSQPPIEMDACPIKFWQSNNSPLNKLGQRYLAAIASSVPCERLFSRAGRIITESRNRLSSEHLQQLLFLGSLPVEDWIS